VTTTSLITQGFMLAMCLFWVGMGVAARHDLTRMAVSMAHSSIWGVGVLLALVISQETS
jgi:hypothetical protein